MRRLIAWWSSHRVATFEETTRGITLTYEPDWVNNRQPSISSALPARLEPYDPPAAERYLGNLLPEGSVREHLCQNFGLDSTDTFGLIWKLGSECAGALQILPAGHAPETEVDPAKLYAGQMSPLDLGHFMQAFAIGPTQPFEGIRPRLSLAGAQRKFTVARFDDEARSDQPEVCAVERADTTAIDQARMTQSATLLGSE